MLAAFWLGAITVTTAEPDTVGSACDIACTVTAVALLLCSAVNATGTELGAVKSPLEFIAPVLAAPPATPFTCQVTAVVGDPLRLALNCTIPKTVTLALPGVTLIDEDGGGGAGVIVTLAEAVFVVSAVKTAVTVTFTALGSCAGAVYRPFVEAVPTVAFPPVMEFTCQVTSGLAPPETVTVNCWVFPTTTLADAGDIVIEVPLGGGWGNCGAPVDEPPDTPPQAPRKTETQMTTISASQ
jgi:hypothetical protein